MTETPTPHVTESATPPVPPPPPDETNPAIIDARKTFAITLVGAALFIGTVVIFVL